MKAYFTKQNHRIVIVYDEYSLTLLLTPTYEFRDYLYIHKMTIEKELKYGSNEAVTDWMLIEISDDFENLSIELKKYL